MLFMPDSIIAALEAKDFQSVTIKNIDNNIKRVHRLLYGNNAKFDMKKLVKDYKKVIKALSSPEIPMTSRKIMYHSIGNVIKVMGINTYGAQELINVRDLVSTYVDEARKFNKEEPVMPLNKIYPKVKKTFEELEEQLTEEFNPKIDIPYIALGFFVFLPPLRAQDYVNTMLMNKTNKEGQNYINLKEGVMVINEYKTVKKYGTRKILLPPPLLEILKDYKKKSNTKWLIPKMYGEKNEPMSVSSFTHLLNRTLDEKISTTELRRAYVSQEVINNDMKGKERKKTAKTMGHSVATQNEIYSKYSKLAD